MDFYSLLIIFIVLEVFESSWQKANTLHGLISNNYTLFSKNIFLYFSFHTTFFYTIFLSLFLNNFGFWMSSIFLLKFMDIAFKLSMMKKLSSGASLSDVMPVNVNMTLIFRYMNVLIYPLSFYFAINT